MQLAAAHAPASEGEVAQALAGLDGAPGIWLGGDAGIPGLHPQQAVLVARPALILRPGTTGVTVQAHSPLGHGLLTQPAIAAWAAASAPGAGRATLASLRAFMALMESVPESLLAGALSFEAWRLAPGAAPPGGHQALGVLYLPEVYYERDALGRWSRVTLSAPEVPPQALPDLPADNPSAPATPQDDFPPGGHAEMVARAVQHLRAVPLVSLTLSQSFRRPFTGSAAAAFGRLRQANPAPVVFMVNDGAGGHLFGASPDLQLVVRGRTVQSLPVCGTVARRPGPVGEAQSLRELFNEEVDAASLAVCSDALRNDLAPLCEPGTLRLLDRRRPMSLATVVHTVDRLQGRLRDGFDAWDCIAATAAPVMVTGTPRALALAAIDRLEASPRGWYGGLTVLVRAGGDALIGTILRAASIRGGVAEVRTGGDLLADSVPEREEAESRLKALSLWRALGLDFAGHPRAAAGAPEPAPLPPAVALLDAQDPLGASAQDALGALGIALVGPGATDLPAVLVGADGPRCAELLQSRGGAHRLLAWGDAAAHVLAHAGFAIGTHEPRHGRTVPCRPTLQAPFAAAGTMTVARYATAGVRSASDPLPAGWIVWAHDGDGLPLVLVHPGQRTVCLLYRPDSLMCEPAAGAVLHAALAVIA